MHFFLVLEVLCDLRPHRIDDYRNEQVQNHERRDEK